MLNLLFISDSPKAEYVKGVLQPLLKVIIDIVTDFDHGLKDVFEKRPATVCIQDQIDGVTGESVARHIQMLLGTSAPKFILLHEGNGKAKAIKGLYEHLVDLSQPDDALAEDLKNNLEMLLGDQWEKIYIPPKPKPAPVKAKDARAEKARDDADRLVDDFLSDLESSGFSVSDDQPSFLSKSDKAPEVLSGAEESVFPPTVESDRAQSISDDLAELLLMEANKAGCNEKPLAGISAEVAEPGAKSSDSPNSVMAPVKSPPPDIAKSAAISESSIGKTSIEKLAVSRPEINDLKIPEAPVMRPQAPSPPAAAEFRISQKPFHAEEQIPEDLLLAFEENYRSESTFMRRTVVVLVCVICIAGGWYLFKQKPGMVASLFQNFKLSKASKQTPAPEPVAIPVQKPVPPTVPLVVAQPLPAFIPKDGQDSAYMEKNPGWERYVGKSAEFRIFRASGRIQAVQVLAVNGEPVSESMIKSVLQEFTGSQDYRIISRSSKAGVRVENGKTMNSGEVVIYRKNGAVKAFVVSVK